MTDITGFGLANHLLNLIKRDNSKTGLTIYPNKIPLFQGVNECLNKDIKSSLFNEIELEKYDPLVSFGFVTSVFLIQYFFMCAL